MSQSGYGSKNMTLNSLKVKSLIADKIMNSEGQVLRSAFASITTSAPTVIPAATTTVQAGLSVALNQSKNVQLVTANGFTVDFAGRYVVNIMAQLIQATSQPITLEILFRPSGGATIGTWIYKFAPGTQTHTAYVVPLYLLANTKYEVAIHNVSATDTLTVQDLDIHVDYMNFQSV